MFVQHIHVYINQIRKGMRAANQVVSAFQSKMMYM
jgi:hypothetical protein